MVDVMVLDKFVLLQLLVEMYDISRQKFVIHIYKADEWGKIIGPLILQIDVWASAFLTIEVCNIVLT